MIGSRARVFVAVVVLPLLVSAAGWATLVFAPWVPDTFVLLPGWSGARDTQGTAATFVALVGLGGCLVGTAWIAFGHRSAPGVRRSAGAVAGALSVGAVGLGLVSAVSQQDAGASPQVLVVTLTAWAATALGAAAGAVLAGAVPSTTLVAREPVPEAAPRTPLAPGEVLVWTGWIRCPWWAYALELLGVALLVTVYSITSQWVLLPVVAGPALVTLLAATTFRVVVGEGGLLLTSLPFGVPRIAIPLDQVARADVVRLSPWVAGGQWGYHSTSIGAVVVTRTGPALQVERGDGSFLAFSMDDAHDAAALLNTLADRRRSVTTVSA